MTTNDTIHTPQTALHETPMEAEKLEPCEHMTDYISAISDGSLRGPAYWFTRFHLLYCRKCSGALRGFRALRSELLSLNGEKQGEIFTFHPETRSALQKALDEMDEKHGG